MTSSFIFDPVMAPARQWSNGNYPAGPNTWSGQPVRVDPVANQITPGEHPAAQEMNFLLGDSSDRLREARTELLKVARINEAAAMQWLVTDFSNIAGVAVTPRGRIIVGAFTAGGSLNHSSLIAGGKRLALGPTPATPGNLTPSCCVANGEKVLCGDSPYSFIFDCDAPAAALPSISVLGGGMLLDAVPDGTGWLTLWSSSVTAAANTTNVRGPRVFRGQPAETLEIRTVSAAGAVGSDTATSAIQNAMSIYTTDEAVKLQLFRCGPPGTVAFFSSALVSERFRFLTSIDNGNTWVSRTANLPAPYPGQDVVGAIEWDSIGNQLVLSMSRASRTSFYRSSDLGATWSSPIEHVRNATYPARGALVSCYDMRRTLNGVILAMGFTVQAITAASYFPVFASVDGGQTWVQVGMVPDAGNGPPTLAAQDAPLMPIGGAGNGFSVPVPPLFGFGAAGP